ncbi:carboxypeptidase regulatory-like domain-containing protein [bacterium]|nr:carboxypeptidase regulatory-like domain-containing protein [bacterium]
MTRLRAALSLALALLLASCGGNEDTGLLLGRSAGPDASAQASLPKLPPVKDYDPARIAAAFEATRLGSQADQSGPGVTFASGTAIFAPLADQLAWTIYRFDGVPTDEVTSLDFTLSDVSTQSQAWFAVSDYLSQSWRFLAPQSASGSIPLSFAPGQLTSASGQIYIAVVGYDLDDFRLHDLTLGFSNRFSVSGQVLDQDGAPLPGVLVTTTLDEGGVVTDAGGTFTLPTIPDGNWHIMATKDSHVFFANPQLVTVAGAPVSGVVFTGYDNASHFELLQGPEPNNIPDDALPLELDSPHFDSLSAIDDKQDCFVLSFDNPGSYYIKLKSNQRVLFPQVRWEYTETYEGSSSPWGMHNTCYLGIDIAEAPATRRIRIDCQGGGGTYTLTLEAGRLSRLEGQLVDDLLSPSEVIAAAKVGFSDGIDEGFVYSVNQNPNYSLLLPPNVYNVIPEDADYTFDPPLQNANLAAGDQLNVNFEAAPVSFSDPYEPNDNAPSATPLTLPVDIPTGGLAVGGSENADYYIVTPEAGKFLRAVVTLRDGGGFSEHINFGLSILDQGQSYLPGVCQRPDAWESRTPTPCDGNPYYVVVASNDLRAHAYGLTIEEFDGTTVSVLCEVDGQPLSDARIDNYILPLELRQQEQRKTGPDGRTDLALGLMQGEQLYLEAFRYGMEFNRQTLTIPAGVDQLEVVFSADGANGLDRLEPNRFGEPGQLTLFSNLSATLDHETDPEDSYIFSSGGQMIRITFGSSGGSDGSLEQFYTIYDQDENELGSYRGFDGSFIFESGSSSSRIEIYCDGGSGSYDLSVEPVEAYYITGQLSHDVPAEELQAGLRIVGREIEPDWLSETDYRIGPLEPGTYSLECYAVNYDVSPANVVSVEISNADVVQDFSLSYSYFDAGEPNNDLIDATPLADGTPFVASLDSENPTDGNDDFDCYQIQASGSGLAKVKVSLAAAWYRDVHCYLLNSLEEQIAESYSSNKSGVMELDLFLPTAGTYYVVLDSSDMDYELTVQHP